jgi:hypothetical protein
MTQPATKHSKANYRTPVKSPLKTRKDSKIAGFFAATRLQARNSVVETISVDLSPQEDENLSDKN